MVRGPELRPKKLGRAGVDFPERLARIALVAPTAHLSHLDAALGADPLHGFDEVETQLFLDEREDVAGFVADEAVVATARDRKVRTLAVVKGARSSIAVP